MASVARCPLAAGCSNAFPNVVLPFIGGFLVDRIGVRKAYVFLSALLTTAQYPLLSPYRIWHPTCRARVTAPVAYGRRGPLRPATSPPRHHGSPGGTSPTSPATSRRRRRCERSSAAARAAPSCLGRTILVSVLRVLTGCSKRT